MKTTSALSVALVNFVAAATRPFRLRNKNDAVERRRRSNLCQALALILVYVALYFVGAYFLQ